MRSRHGRLGGRTACRIVVTAIAALFPLFAQNASARSPATESDMLPLTAQGPLSIAAPVRPASVPICDRARALAARLGETYAGHRLRQSVLQQHCPFSTYASPRDHIWRWPWHNLTASADDRSSAPAVTDTMLPPRLVHKSGDWQIRCGRAGTRQRCALARVETVTQLTEYAGLPAPPLKPVVVVHFVVDRIAERSVVLFRLFAPGLPAAQPAAPNAALFTLSSGEIRIPFDTCNARGCMLETTPTLATAIYNRLSFGEMFNVRLETSAPALGDVATGMIKSTGIAISTDGFRDGFLKLLHLDRKAASRAEAP